MITKELLERRWQLLGGMLLAVLTVTAGLVSRSLLGDQMRAPTEEVPEFMRGQLDMLAGSWDAYAWYQAFNPAQAVGPILIILAAIIGGSLIASETARSTIFTLLARPVSRTRVLLTKYAVGAGILLAVATTGAATMLVVSLLFGHPQPLGGALVSLLNFWLGSLFALGIATVFSTVSSDVLRPVAFALVVVLALSAPAFFQGGSAYVLPAYWSSLPAYLGQEFPWKNLLISLAGAIVPLLAAVPLFRKQQY
ncbi:MAG TPA: ABC transporter permease subunit [Deinococcales bacterium]|nr:ABC transporter permease subunit [Deinococcales bacterium]